MRSAMSQDNMTRFCNASSTSIAAAWHPAMAPVDAVCLAIRSVHRAISELRRGTPVLIHGAKGAVVVAAAETIGGRGMAALSAAASTPPVLLLAMSRAAAILPALVPPSRTNTQDDPGAVAIRLPPDLFTPEALQRLADPTVEKLLPAMPQRASLPPFADAGLALAKLGRLLPALVAAPSQKAGGERLSLLSVQADDVLGYPIDTASSLHRVAVARVPLEEAEEVQIVAFRAADGGIEHLAMIVGDPAKVLADGGAPLVRLHSECFTGDLLGSLRCDCGSQLRGALRAMAESGAGVLLYLAQEGRGIGLVNKLRAYTLQDHGLDTLDANRALGYGADERDFLVASTMLRLLGVPRVRLLTNNPDKIAALSACGIEVVSREALVFAGNGVNDHYLATKAERFGHLL